MGSIIAYALQALEAIPTLIAAGQSVIGLIQHSTAALKLMQTENRDPTDQEWADLNATIDALRQQLHN